MYTRMSRLPSACVRRKRGAGVTPWRWGTLAASGRGRDGTLDLPRLFLEVPVLWVCDWQRGALP